MKSKPRRKAAHATVAVEVIRGIRLAYGGETLEILDLHSGQFEAVKVDVTRHPGRIATGRAGWLMSLPWLSEALPDGIFGLSGGDFVTVDDMRAALSSAPERASPPFPCPSAATVRGICFPVPWERPDSGDVGQMLAVALALAWRGGKAYEMELGGDLARRLRGRLSARAAMDEALRRSDGNIRREGHGNFAVWRMREEWKRDNPNEYFSKGHEEGTSGELGDLFDEDKA